MRFHIDPEGFGLCSLDPVTLTAAGSAIWGALSSSAGTAALAGAGAGLAGASILGGASSNPSAPADPTQSPPVQAPPVQQPAANPRQNQNQTPSFIGSAVTPPASFGQKTLLGQ